MQRMPHFSANRAKTDVRSTSRLSPHLHHGEISTRHNYYVVSCACRCPRQGSACRRIFNVWMRAVHYLEMGIDRTPGHADDCINSFPVKFIPSQYLMSPSCAIDFTLDLRRPGEAAGGGLCCERGEGGGQGGEPLLR